MAIRLNSIDPNVYDSAAKEFSNAERERADIVTCGRLLMRERLGRDERQELVDGVVREIHLRGAQARFGSLGRDGRLGGAPEA